MTRKNPLRPPLVSGKHRARPVAVGSTGDRHGDASGSGASAIAADGFDAFPKANRKALLERVLAMPPPGPDSFPGCRMVRMTEDEFLKYERRIEYWDADREVLWELRDTPTIQHEGPSQRLTQLVAYIAAVRGAPILCYGAVGLLVRDLDGRTRRAMQGDQCIYLRRPRLPEPRVVAGAGDMPDVVMEVDHTTDVRRYKLAQYEAWGFPEVWVEVPDQETKSRPRSLRPGLAIHLLDEGGVYRPSLSSIAFPGWTAGDIHKALNEEAVSVHTYAVLQRIGRALGDRAGTGPEDNPMLRSQRAEGRAEGRVEGREEDRAGMLQAMLSARGIAVSVRFGSFAPALAALPRDVVAGAALDCTSEADMLARLGIRG